ncbi:hypothetical protein JGU71_09150 [Antrihabitans sp. YC3-6]|uniref:Uncharacterized protein n=1 Tax=Antrihabitans stalagmiti TaxID=2799499 RepID=A0A934NPT9_9NOCA|nr:hypothetical protein [Antrihabitans stalagmiti]MBJ8339050.1 hypothetical protein [Antrihabitans stalagmiti]
MSAGRAQRTISVLIQEVAIEDGQITPPQVDAVIEFPLRFVELPSSCGDAVTIRAVLEPNEHNPVLQRTGLDAMHRWQWTGLLRGDGWTASWRGDRPLTGAVELTGKFYGVMGYDTDGRVRGRVRRVQIVSERFQPKPGESRSWRLLGGYRKLREVDRAPRFFDRGDTYRVESTEDKPREFDREVGALIELDLDDVPDLPLRQSIVPGAVSSAANTLWVLDRELPLVVQISNGAAVEQLLPGAITSELGRSIWATPTGCWVAGSDGTYRCGDGQPPRRIDSVAVRAGAAIGETLLACSARGPWTLHTPDDEPIVIEAPKGLVQSIVTDDGSFVVLLREPDQKDHTTARDRLVRVGVGGDVKLGPATTFGSRYRALLAGEPLRVCQDAELFIAADDLTLRAVGTLPRSPIYGGQVGPYFWIVDHPPDGSGRSGWWPVDGPVPNDATRQAWLFTLLDANFEPIVSAPIFRPDPSVTIDPDGTVWVVADGLRRISDRSMEPPTEVDVAALLDRVRGE